MDRLAPTGAGASGQVVVEEDHFAERSLQPAAALELLVEQLLRRLARIFLCEGEAPRPSRWDEVRNDAALELVVVADVARTRFWGAHEEEVVAACGVAIDKQEVFAYLLADALGRPLLHRDDARDVGQRGDNAAAKARRLLKITARKEVAEACLRALIAKPTALATQAPYDLKLPSATVGAKRTAVQWGVRDVKAAYAKVAKAAAQYALASAYLLAADTSYSRTEAACKSTFSLATGDFSQSADRRIEQALVASETAGERWVAAHAEKRAAADTFIQTQAERSAAASELAAALAAESDWEKSNEEEPVVWEWDEHTSVFEIIQERDAMVCGVAMAAAGFASCAHCAYLLVRTAVDLVCELEEPLEPLAATTDEFHNAWSATRLLSDTIITPDSFAAAAESAPRCAGCLAVGAHGSPLTTEGEHAAQAAAAAELKRRRVSWLQRSKSPERAREFDTFHWDSKRQGHVLVSLPAWLGDLGTAQRFMMQAQQRRDGVE